MPIRMAATRLIIAFLLGLHIPAATAIKALQSHQLLPRLTTVSSINSSSSSNSVGKPLAISRENLPIACRRPSNPNALSDLRARQANISSSLSHLNNTSSLTVGDDEMVTIWSTTLDSTEAYTHVQTPDFEVPNDPIFEYAFFWFSSVPLVVTEYSRQADRYGRMPMAWQKQTISRAGGQEVGDKYYWLDGRRREFGAMKVMFEIDVAPSEREVLGCLNWSVQVVEGDGNGGSISSIVGKEQHADPTHEGGTVEIIA